LVFALQNLTYALENSELHQKTLYEIAKQTHSEQNSYIRVGKDPVAIAVDAYANKIYVANMGDNTVSVIDGTTNTKIGNDIKVGKSPIAVDAYANKIYVANTFDNTVSVIDGTTNTKIGNDIKVGSRPSAIVFYYFTNKIYVANTFDNTVSVIDGTTNTKIGNDIKVGSRPSAIEAFQNKIYVANTFDNTVSVIDGTTNTKIGNDIKVGKSPTDLAVAVDDPMVTRHIAIYVSNMGDNTVSVIDGTTNTKIGNDIKVGKSPTDLAVDDPIFAPSMVIYVANTGDNTVSVIDGTTNTKIGNDIKVGSRPSAIDKATSTNTTYVANIYDGTVSVIDAEANKVVAKVMFNIEPFNSGHIECDKDKLKPPIAQQFYIWPGSVCTAKPNQGFEFVSWQENLGGNSTQFIKYSSAPSIWQPILDFLYMKPDKPEAKLDITKFGNFTANFKTLPPPLPPEYVATLFAVVVTAFVSSWLTPTIIGWRKTKKQGSILDHYHNEVKKLYNDGKLDRNDIKKLNELRNKIIDDYIRGKINKEQYDKLGDFISINYGEIFIKEINSLNVISENDHKVKLLSPIKNHVEDMHAKGKINNEYYVRLKNEISMMYQEIYSKKISLLNREFNSSVLLDKIKNDIADAYAQGKISDQHYNLLSKKISDHENKHMLIDEKLLPPIGNKYYLSQGSPIKINK
jgi:YVTN family beta-propeller protein